MEPNPRTGGCEGGMGCDSFRVRIFCVRRMYVAICSGSFGVIERHRYG